MADVKKDADLSNSYSGTSKSKQDKDHKVGGAVGAGVGATAGAIGGMAAAAKGAATGAMVGSVAGFPGTVAGSVAGAAIGGIAGALAGDYIAQKINPTEEEDYWRNQFKSRNYASANDTFDTYRPAYRYGMDSYIRNRDKRFEDVEPQLRSDWEKSEYAAALPWDRASRAARDSYERLYTRNNQSSDV